MTDPSQRAESVKIQFAMELLGNTGANVFSTFAVMAIMIMTRRRPPAPGAAILQPTHWAGVTYEH